MTDLNEELLTEDPESQAIEATEDTVYFDPEPDEESSLVVTEPPIITIGREKRRAALRSVPPEQQ